MGKKGKKIAKAAAALGTAYLASKMGQMERSRGIGTSMDTDTEFKGKVANLTKKGMERKMEDAPIMKPFAESGLSSRQKQINRNRKFFGMDEKTYFQGGGMVTTKGQGKVMKPKKTILLT